MFARTIERVGLVALGAVASAAMFAIADGSGPDLSASTQVAGSIAVSPSLLAGESRADRQADDVFSSVETRLSRPLPTTDPLPEHHGVDRADGTDLPPSSVAEPIGDAPATKARVASASVGVASSLMVELAPANQIFGTTTTTLPPTTTTTTSPPQPPEPVLTATTVAVPRPTGRTVEGAEWRLLNGINAKRNRSGVNGISMNEIARTEARRWSKEMANRSHFDHRPDISSGIPNRIIGENVATGGDITSIDVGLWNSQSHRDNILSVNFSEVGIGVWYDGRTGQFWVTEIFVG